MNNPLTSRFPVTIFLLALLSLAGLSCEKVVDIDLNSSDPHIVIEGNIDDSSVPSIVKLSQTVNYDEPNAFPPISGATITLLDNLGNADSLTESSPGTYSGSNIQGIPGRTYTLTVLADGKEYFATSTMPSPVQIDSLTVSTRAFGRNTGKVVNVNFQDPPNEKAGYVHPLRLRD